MSWTTSAGILNSIVQLVITWYGVHVSLEKHHRKTAFVVGSLGLCGIILTGYIGYENDKAQQALMDEATGGDSYGEVRPMGIPISPSETIFRLFLVRKGQYPLFDVNVTMFEGPLSGDTLNVLEQVDKSGIFSSSSVSNPILLPRTIKPASTGITTYFVNVVARNGVAHEKLLIRHNGSLRQDGTVITLPWDFSYEITRNGTLVERESWQTLQYDTQIH